MDSEHADSKGADVNVGAFQPVSFLLSAPGLRFLPDPIAPEVALAGRSNVGKSSLLNALIGYRSMARASNRPGRTQALNFFDVGAPLHFRLVDMPGYGYANAPRDVARQWAGLVNAYLRGRAPLKRVLLLIDARRGIMERDQAIMALLDKAAISYQLILTKSDKLKTTALDKVLDDTRRIAVKHAAAYPDILATSATKKIGIDDLRAAVCAAVEG